MCVCVCVCVPMWERVGLYLRRRERESREMKKIMKLREEEVDVFNVVVTIEKKIKDGGR